MRSRIQLALAIAVLGTAMFLVLRTLLFGLLEPPLYVAGCFVGAFLSCLSMAAPQRRSFVSWLQPAAGICLSTYAVIAVAHLLYRAGTWDRTVPGEAATLVFWAVVATSWWLIPAVAAALTWIAAILAKRTTNDAADRPAV